MAAEGEYPKIDGDIYYASEANYAAGFGDGSDGVFNETSGTTNLTQGTVYQYSSFTLDTSATLSASSTSHYPIIIYVQGDCTINGTINLVGKGSAAGDGFNGTSAAVTSPLQFATGAATSSSAATAYVGRKGGNMFNFQMNQAFCMIMNGTGGASGSGGQGGSAGASSSNSGAAGESDVTPAGAVSGAGGAGGCTLVIIVGGDLTFGASSSINVSGADGGDGSRDGGGGGGSGDVLIFYNGTQTDNGVTVTTNGGAAGTDTTDGNSDGGAGGNGQSKIVAYNTIFWSK